jgi:hypothetical protein
MKTIREVTLHGLKPGIGREFTLSTTALRQTSLVPIAAFSEPERAKQQGYTPL